MKKAFKKPGFKQFAIRTAVFFFILLGLQFAIFLYFSKTLFFKRYLEIPTAFYFSMLQGLSKQDFLNSAIFVIVAFLLWKRKEIMNLKPYGQNYRQTAVFGILTALAILSHYIFKYLIVLNLNAAMKHALLITLVKYSINILAVIFLAIAVYNTNFIKLFFRNHYKSILFFTAILFLYYKIIEWFQGSWLFFSTAVGEILRFVFSLFFNNVTFYKSASMGPILGVNNFRVGISKVCSGIDSLLFFISLFAILAVLNWNDMNKKKMAALFVPGVILTFVVNIIRVFLIILIGQKYPEFAIDLFHTNAGWILFLAYFITFWHFGSRWVLGHD